MIKAYWKAPGHSENHKLVGTVLSFEGDEVQIRADSAGDFNIIFMKLENLYLEDVPNPEVSMEIFNKEKRYWGRINMSLIKKGDVFRIYEPDGSRRCDSQGNNVFVAASDAYKNPDGIWQVSTIY